MGKHRNSDICTWPDGPEACENDPKGCFACKLRHWQANGGLSVQYPYGRDVFHGQSIKERQAHEIDQAAAAGNEIRPKSGMYTGGI